MIEEEFFDRFQVLIAQSLWVDMGANLGMKITLVFEIVLSTY